MDRASKILVEGLPISQPCTYAALSAHGKVPRSTVWHRAHGRSLREDKAKSQQYLTPIDEKAPTQHLKRIADIGYPIPIKHLRSLAFIIARQRSATNLVVKPPGKNWPKAFKKRHLELTSRKLKPVDWNRYNNNIYDKIVH
jgi:hypothetical protein